MPVSRTLTVSALSLLLFPGLAFAQNTLIASADTPAESSSALPEAPSTTLRGYTLPADGAMLPQQNFASKYTLVIEPDQTAQHLTGGEKVVLGVRSTFTLTALAGAVISAGYSHVTNGQPNYGTNGLAFGKRFGASLARGASQNIFSNAVLAPVMHVDERYYVMGDGHNVIHRAWYAATRVLVAKTDGGHNTVNAPLLAGYAGAAALTNVYYPQINRNFKDTATGYGGSLGGAALGYVVSEFQSDILRAVHLKKK